MLDECGVQLMDKVIRLGGHSAPRTMVPKAASGGGIVVPIHPKRRIKVTSDFYGLTFS